MSGAHLQGQLRECGATTITTQSFVTIGGKAWAVEGDTNSHGQGGLIASKSYIKIGGKSVIIQGDNANPDLRCGTLGGSPQDCNPKAAEGSSFVTVG